MNTMRHILLVKGLAALLGLTFALFASAIAARSEEQLLRDGYYGIYDPALPSYSSMWDTVLVCGGSIVYDCGIVLATVRCTTDTSIRYKQINPMQILRAAPDGSQSVLAWYKEPD
jgi:hypothetical protein